MFSQPTVLPLLDSIERYATANQNREGVPEEAVYIKKGEGLNVQPGSMLAYRNVELTTSLNEKTAWGKVKNFFLGGQSLFTNQYLANEKDGWLLFEENPYQIYAAEIHSRGLGLNVSENALVAFTPNISLETSYAGISGIMRGIGLGVTNAQLKPEAAISGSTGTLYFKSGFGNVKAVEVTHKSPVYVDNDDIVAYTEGLHATVSKVGNSIKSLFLSGEGFVCKFEGDGTVFVGAGLAKLRREFSQAQHKESAGVALLAGLFLFALIMAGAAGALVSGLDAKPPTH